MFVTKAEAKVLLRAIINDEQDNDIVFITGSPGIGKTELLSDIKELLISEKDSIYVDGSLLQSNISVLQRGFIEGIYKLFNRNDFFLDDLEDLEKAYRNYSLDKLKNEYCDLGKNVPLVFLIYPYKLKPKDWKYLESLSIDTLQAKVTFIIACKLTPDLVLRINELLNIDPKRITVLPLMPPVQPCYADSIDNITQINIKHDNHIFRGYQNILPKVNGEIEFQQTLNLITRIGYNKSLFFLHPLFANQEISPKHVASIKLLYQLLNEDIQQYRNLDDTRMRTLFCLYHGKYIWIDPLSYYIITNEQKDLIINNLQLFFCGLIENCPIIHMEKKTKKLVFCFFKETSKFSETNLLTTELQKYYRNFSYLSLVATSTYLGKNPSWERANRAIEFYSKKDFPLFMPFLRALPILYEATASCAIYDKGIELIANSQQIDLNRYYDEINHFLNDCILVAFQWKDISLIDSLISFIQSNSIFLIIIPKEVFSEQSNEFLLSYVTSKPQIKNKIIGDGNMCIYNEKYLEIVLDEESRKNLNALKRANNNIIPFIGAGMSIPLGYPGWKDFLNNICDEILQNSDLPHSTIHQIKELIIAEKYLEAADQINAIYNKQFKKIIAKTYSLDKWNGKQPDYLQVFRKLGCDTIVTTNYDMIIENFWEHNGIKADIIYPYSTVHIARNMVENRKQLIKLHGTYQDHDTIVITSSDYRKAYQKNGVLYKTIQSLTSSSKVILFIGCSLSDDSLFNTLQEIAGSQLRDYSQYALLPYFLNEDLSAVKNEERRKNKKNFELARLGIDIIWYPVKNNDHSNLFSILNYLAN